MQRAALLIIAFSAPYTIGSVTYFLQLWFGDWSHLRRIPAILNSHYHKVLVHHSIYERVYKHRLSCGIPHVNELYMVLECKTAEKTSSTGISPHASTATAFVRDLR